MTRNRATTGSAGTVVFVGAGPGDPGMLTARAQAALAQAGLVIVDPDVSAAVQDAVRGRPPGAGAQPRPPASRPRWPRPPSPPPRAARSSSGSSPATRTPPTPRSRRCSPSAAPRCPSTSCRGSPPRPPCRPSPAWPWAARRSPPTCAPAPTWPRWRPRRPPPAARWSCRADAEDLPDAAARLVEGGLSGSTPVVVTAGGSGTAQKSVVAKLVRRRREDRRPRRARPARSSPPSAPPSTSAPSCPGGRAGRCSAGGCWCRAPRTRPAR